MTTKIKTSVTSSLLVILFAACTTVPETSTLTSGIDMTQASKNTPGTMRSQSDPVCVQFYQNVNSYVAAANRPNKGGGLLTSMGLGIIASVATAGIVPTGLGTVGQAAASTAVSTTIQQGGHMIVDGIKSESPVGKISQRQPPRSDVPFKSPDRSLCVVEIKDHAGGHRTKSKP